MKKTLLAGAVAVLLCSCGGNTVPPAIPQDARMEKRIKEMVSKMTIEEKAGQMLQLAIGMFQKQNNPFSDAGVNIMEDSADKIRPVLQKYGIEDEFELSDDMGIDVRYVIYMRILSLANSGDFVLDTEKLSKVFREYKVGSILNVPGDHAQDIDTWQSIIRTIQDSSLAITGIPCVYGVDQIHGTTYTQGGTLFPHGVNLAASFNRKFSRCSSEVSAYESKACSIPWIFAPVADLGRSACWPRMWENFGEDAYLSSEMARESIIGFQGTDPNHIGAANAGACMKHYMGYGVPASGKDRTPAHITTEEIREKHFAPYLEMVRAGALSVMINSGMYNGLPTHANYELITLWLKEGLNWDGLVVTDWGDIDSLWKRDRVAHDKKEAIKMAINAGIDMSMDPYNTDFCDLLIELVNEGEIPMSRIDDAVSRILRFKMRLGLFEKPYWDKEDYPLFGCEEYRADALAAAEESLVLLKNDDAVLPLPRGKRILVTGPNSNSMRAINGGWSYTWQGADADFYSGEHNTIYEALSAKFGARNVVWEPGVTYKDDGSWFEENPPQIAKAVAAAAGVDYIVACIGENSYAETVGNLSDLTLSRNQLDLVKALSKTGKPIILVLNEGRPRIIAEIEPLAKAVVDIMLPGDYGGDALAGVLSGDVNPSGKMPFTYPKEVNSLVNYDYKPCEHIGTPMEGAYNYDAQVSFQWAFGYGLSYTTFSYSNLTVDKTEFAYDDDLTFTVDVTNTGSVAGKESVLLFASDLVASVSPDNRRLRAFDKVELDPGQTKTVTLKIKGSDLAFVGYDGKWIIEKGDFRVQVGDQVTELTCTQTHKWESQNK